MGTDALPFGRVKAKVGNFGGYTVAQLAGLAPAEGDITYATDGRKSGEGPGAGTGVPVYYSSGVWRVFSTDAAVAS